LGAYGVQQGEGKLLRRVLTRRFGPLPSWAEQRLEQAGETQLEAWADRVLECRSLEEVLVGVRACLLDKDSQNSASIKIPAVGWTSDSPVHRIPRRH
jgi:hypothetical protein